MKSSKILLIVLVATPLIFLTSRFWIEKEVLSTEDIEGLENASTTDNIEIQGIQAVLKDKNGKVTITDITPKPESGGVPKPIPSLDRVIQFPSSLPLDARTIITEKITKLTQTLKQEPSGVQSWIDLGVLRKIVGDYDGAREAWVYATQLNTKATIPHQNLADLYTSYLKDYPKAETEWKLVIALDPKNSLAYRGLYDLYHLSYKEKDSLALSVLQDGLKVNPMDIDLMNLTARHYKDIGDTTNARKYYEMALLRAKDLNNLNLQKLIEDELASFR